jgi:predicted nucleotidyltransferase
MGAKSIWVDTTAAALFGSVRQAVLGLFFDHPDERFYQRQVVQSLAIGSGAVQRELARLVAGGILTRTVEGRQAYYQVNQNGTVYPELHGLVRKTMGVAGVLRESLGPLAGQVRLAFIYGSMARREEQAQSDVDLMIVGDNIRLSEISPIIHSARQALRREVNPTTYRTEEFLRKLNEGHHFVCGVVNGPKVFLIGSQDELDRLAERGTGDAPIARQSRAR